MSAAGFSMEWTHKALEQLHVMDVVMRNPLKQVDGLLNARHAGLPGGQTIPEESHPE